MGGPLQLARHRETICERHNLTAWDTNLVCWLVEQHLVMSSTAQRKDMDPEVVHEFASIVKDQVRLDYIYTSTPQTSTRQPDALEQLACITAQPTSTTTKTAASRQSLRKQNTLPRIRTARSLPRGVRIDESRPCVFQFEEFFLRESVSDIARFTTAIAQHQIEYKSDALVLIEDMISRREGATQNFIYTQNRVFRLYCDCV